MESSKQFSSVITKGGSRKAKFQKFGGFLTAMVLPIIGAFIAWGLITAFFIPTGWIPNAALGSLVSPMITYLLPVLIGYQGGKLVYGTRGGVVGAIATMGVIVGASVPMFLGAMIVGPLGGYLMKKFDQAVEGKIPTGFEMLVNNFSAGILGGLLTLLSFALIGPVVNAVSVGLGSGALWITNARLLPLIAILVEPGKILFLNNAINHGVFDPLGVAQVKEVGKSIFFLLETDPGPGVGILVAYWLYGKGNAKQSAPSAIIIQFLGGIHEIYFPYVLMNPLLLIAVICAGMCADLTFVLLKAGLVASPSPGSIFAEIAMSPRGGLPSVLAGIVVGAVVSFLIASVILKRTNTGEDNEAFDESFSAAKNLVAGLKAESKGQEAFDKSSSAGQKAGTAAMPVPSLIVFACDAGMGSSAMGESILKKKLKNAGLEIAVKHSPVNEIPKSAEVVFTQENLAERAAQVAPEAKIVTIKNFLENTAYDQFIESLKK
jgi:PTS system mannitol-specific IIC component